MSLESCKFGSYILSPPHQGCLYLEQPSTYPLRKKVLQGELSYRSKSLRLELHRSKGSDPSCHTDYIGRCAEAVVGILQSPEFEIPI